MNTYSLTQTQIGIYLSEQSASEDVNYNIARMYRLDKDVSLQRLEKALQEVIDNHPGVKARIVISDDGELLFESHDEEAVAISRFDSEDELRDEMQRKFDLTGERLYRLGICCTTDGIVFGASFHHVNFDGMSYFHFIQELHDAYEGKPLVPEIKDNYAIAQEDAALRAGNALEEQRQWYLKNFEGVAGYPTSLPPDFSGGGLYKVTNVEMTGIDNAAISDFCKRTGHKAATLVTTAFGITLARFNGVSRTLFSTIHHGRFDKDTRSAYTMMVKTLPVLLNFENFVSVDEVLTATGEQMADTRKRTVFSFAEFCGSMGINPDVLFTYQGSLSYTLELEGKSFQEVDLRVPRPGFTSTYEVRTRSDGSMFCIINYDSGKYSEAMIVSFVNAFENVLRCMLAKEQLSEIQLLSAVAQEEVLALGRGPEMEFDRSQTIVSLFRKQAAATPDALCVVYDDPDTGARRSYSYREVDELTDRMARHLASLGVGPEQVVGVMIGRSEKILLFPLAILKAGGAYMPLDSHFPEDRLSFMCEDAGVRIILTEGDLLKTALPSFDGTALTLEEVVADVEAEITAAAPENMHVILYTSGSTGKPKGVILEQHNLVNFCHWFTQHFSVTAKDKVAAFANFGFDVHQADIWPALTVGASIYVIPQDMRLDLAGLEEYIDRNELTLANITTQIGSMFAASVERSSLRALVVAGEKLGPTRKPEYGFYNAYGPTECTIYATCYDILQDYDSSIIGGAMSNYAVAVVDGNLNLLPVGVPGELIIMGEGVGRGYLNRPDVTAEKFITFHNQKAYRSGDQVRMMPDGQIDYIGRMDGQVKLRGLRIELGEVEAAILRHPAIKACAAAVKEIAGTQHLCAYYILKDGQEASAAEIKDFMAQSVTDFMVPDFLTQLDHLPYNANGKVDRKQLPTPEASAEEAVSTSDAGHVWNKLQSAIRDIVSGLTGAEGIGISSPLRVFGLTSLLAMKLASQLYKKYRVRIPAKDLPSISVFDIEERVIDLLSEGPEEQSAEKTSPNTEAALTQAPLTFSQQGVYMDCQMNPDTTMYNIARALTFPEGVSAQMLKNAVIKVLSAHTALFCNFFSSEEGAVMRLSQDKNIDVPMKEMGKDEINAERQAFVRPFNLESDRLVRAEIITSQDGRCTLLLDAHHLVTDGSSIAIIIKQITDVLNGKEIEKESTGYLSFAVSQYERASKGCLESDKTFFDKMFALYESAANVPTDKSTNEGGTPHHASTAIPAGLLDLSLPEGVTQAHFWFAAFNYTLSRYANTKDVFTSFISGGRQNIDIADTVGMFVNTLPCAVHIKEQTVSDFLTEVSHAFSDVIDHENYPFTRIASDYDFKGSASYAYQMGLQSSCLVGGKPIVDCPCAALSKAKIPFCIFIQNVNGVPCVDAEYDDSKYSHELALRFTESIVAVAEHFAASMSAKVNEISIMSERQRQEVGAMHFYRKEEVIIQTIHEGFEQWAEKTPEAMAIITSDRCLTYGEYNAEANRLARALLAHGVRYGDRIVLLLPRRSYYLTSLFAVLKTGAAFIPMDPEYPADRIAYILDDSQGRFVLTTDDKLADYPDRALSITELMEEARSLPGDNLNVRVNPHDLAYVIYTSGSTGRPKGVMIEHFGASNFLRYWTESCPGLDMTKYIAISQATVSFDYSIAEFGMQLFNGATVAFANEEETKNPMEMIKFCKRFGINAMNGTPSRVAVNMEIEDYKEMMRSQMKLLTVGGEKLPWTMVEDIKAMGITLVNAYGPTETSMGSSAAIMNDAREVHVGKPFPNYSYMVLDSDRNELPVGVMGELCIGGIGLARGYNNMPERTAETFIMWHGERIYRTGDYAMWTDEGNVIIMGRTDNQVKLNGLRIELGEVETVMKQQPGIRQCVAAIKKIGNIDKLIGYYTTFESVDETQFEEGMRQMMGEHLTPYMVPGVFMHLDEMPLTPVGKTDVKRLPLPEVQLSEYVAPANDIEKLLCEAFATTLRLERVGATNNFFELGGTSLVAMRLIGLAVKANLNMVYKNIFDNPTPRQLAMMLHPEMYANAAAIDKKEDKEMYPFQKEVESYDYGALEEVLARNTLKSFMQGSMYEHIGNVFLTGATGFLGIHVLHNLICRDDVPHIYCLVRGGKAISAQSRLHTLLFYYFGNSYKELFGNRIVIVEGDVTNSQIFHSFNEPLDLVINCAANVKHFSAGTDIEDINIEGCRNCIDLCLRVGARFVQTSTGSITGSTVSDEPVAQHYLTERELYYGQALFSKYSSSKFLAERAVLDAVRYRGLKGKIVRLGNLCARSTDGEFQINFHSNTFMGKLKAYQVLGCVPYSSDCGFSEFSPINEVADAILRLALTPDECTVFHPVNVHWPPLGDVIECMNHLGLNIKRVEDDVFAERLAKAMADEETATIMQSLVGYKNAVDGKYIINNTCDVTSYTAQVLLRLGFRWSFTSWDYMESYLRSLVGLGVFDKDYQR